MTRDGNQEVNNLTGRPAAQANDVAHNGQARPSEPPASMPSPNANLAMDRAKVLAVQIRSSRIGHPLGKGISIRDMVNEGRATTTNRSRFNAWSQAAKVDDATG